jgi:hypothetical protein
MSKAIFPVQQITRTKTRTALLGQGQRMSNFLYNLAQQSNVPQDWRDGAKMLVEAWDALKLGRKS